MDRVVHFEIPVEDLDRAKQFYSSIFGWVLTDFPGMDYTGIGTVASDDQGMPAEPGAINGGMMKRTEDAPGPVVTIEVGSVDEYLQKVAAAGGRVVRGKGEVPGMGYFAYIADPENNVIGLWQNLQ